MPTSPSRIGRRQLLWAARAAVLVVSRSALATGPATGLQRSPANLALRSPRACRPATSATVGPRRGPGPTVQAGCGSSSSIATAPDTAAWCPARWCRKRRTSPGQVLVGGLPSGEHVRYRVWIESERGQRGPAEEGSFRTPGVTTSVRFVWTGDCAGQGWGINPDWAGCAASRRCAGSRPDFFVFSGDTVYADGRS